MPPTSNPLSCRSSPSARACEAFRPMPTSRCSIPTTPRLTALPYRPSTFEKRWTSSERRARIARNNLAHVLTATLALRLVPVSTARCLADAIAVAVTAMRASEGLRQGGSSSSKKMRISTKSCRSRSRQTPVVFSSSVSHSCLAAETSLVPSHLSLLLASICTSL